MAINTLSFLSDALLSLCDRDPEAPHYTEATFRRKTELARVRESQTRLPFPNPLTDGLFRREWQQILQRAGLTARQREVCTQRLSGWTFEEIGRTAGHSKQGAQSIFLQAVKKIRAVWSVYPYAGLSSIYRQEVQRGLRPSGTGRLKT